MQIGHERALDLAKRIAAVLAKSPGLKLRGKREALTNALFRGLTDAAREEEAMAEKVRAKIRTLKRGVMEGSREWDVLFERYFREEEERAGVPTRRP